MSAVRTVLYTILACFLLLTGGASFASSVLFTVENVAVDVRAENALEAREQAFTQAQIKAFEKLAQRMISDGEALNFETPDPLTISSLIRDYEVTSEKLSAGRYIGTYTFRFKDKEVRNFFSGRGVSYTDVSSRPMLILPFFQARGGMTLWGADNVWMQAWNARDNSSSGLVPIVLPIGDLQDVREIGDNQAMSYRDAALRSMLVRYDAGEAVIAVAVPDEGLAGVENAGDPARGALSVNLYRTDRAGPEYVHQFFVSARSGQTREALYEEAAQQTRRALRRDWKEKTTARGSNTNILQVRVSYESLEEWAKTQRALERVYGVEEVILHSLTPRLARIDLKYQGTPQRLRLALQQADMVLSEPEIHQQSFDASLPVQGGLPVVYDLRYNRARAPLDDVPPEEAEAGAPFSPEAEAVIQNYQQTF